MITRPQIPDSMPTTFPLNSSDWYPKISLAALCAMLILPFVNPHHFRPIPTFFQEWSAAACGLLAASLIFRKQTLAQLEIPSVALLPLSLIGLLLVQFAFGLIANVPQALVVALYLLWALLIMVLGRSLRQQFPLESLTTQLAASLLFGALLSSVILAFQLFGAEFAGRWVVTYVRGTANLAQANHLANYLWLGIASAIYLHSQGKLGNLFFALCTLVLIASASLTGSRSVLLYASGFALLSLWATWHYKNTTAQPFLKRIAVITVLLVPTTIALQIALTQLELNHSYQITVSGERLFREVSGTSQRLQLWRTAIEIYTQHPWLGSGVGQFPFNSYLAVGAQADGGLLGGGEHAHNIFLHLLAEFGPAAPILVILLSLHWWLSFVRQKWTSAHWWIAALLLVLGTHSQLEYPLWYTYFLGIAALLLGLGSNDGKHPDISATGRMLANLILILGAVTLATFVSDYRTLEQTLNKRANASGERPSWRSTLDSLATLQKESLFSPYVELSYAYQLEVNREKLKDKITVTQIAIRFSPVDLITFKLAYLLALDGQRDAAQIALHRAMATHPSYIPEARLQLDELSKRYPELQALRDQLPNQENTEHIPSSASADRLAR